MAAPRKRASRIKKILTAIALAAAAFAYHIADPTLIPRLSYPYKPSRIEEQHGITYYGDQDESRQATLNILLHHISTENPSLLEHCKTIILHDDRITSISHFVYFEGRANPFGTVELCSVSPSLLAHELAHIKYFHAPDGLEERLEGLFGGDIGKNLRPKRHYFLNLPGEWADGTDEPRHGFISPYGAKNTHELVATYVGAVFDPGFNWQQPVFSSTRRYVETLELLRDYEFISAQQCEHVKEEIMLGDSGIALRQNLSRQ